MSDYGVPDEEDRQDIVPIAMADEVNSLPPGWGIWKNPGVGWTPQLSPEEYSDALDYRFLSQEGFALLLCNGAHDDNLVTHWLWRIAAYRAYFMQTATVKDGRLDWAAMISGEISFNKVLKESKDHKWIGQWSIPAEDNLFGHDDLDIFEWAYVVQRSNSRTPGRHSNLQLWVHRYVTAQWTAFLNKYK